MLSADAEVLLVEFRKQELARRDRCREYQNKWRAENIEARRESNRVSAQRHYASRRVPRLLMKKYGITVEQRDAMLAAQGDRCGMCPATAPGGRGTWHVDHDHKTGRVRSLLCQPCNLILGQAGDDVTILAAGIAYLEKHNELQKGRARPQLTPHTCADPEDGSGLQRHRRNDPQALRAEQG